MKKLHYVLPLLMICTVSKAGLISHTDYTAGNVITAAGQNSNENTIVNEINGSLDSANIEAGGIENSDIANTTIEIGKLATVVQSSITIGVNLATYRRPSLVYNSGTVVNIETALLGTSGQAAIVFPDGTLRRDSTSTHIQLNLAQVASLTGTVQSGVRTGSVASNTWYAVYAVKSQANSTDFVLVADSQTFTTTAYATLNTNFGTNSWVYLGLIRYGDQVSAPTGVCSFVQSGNMTLFNNPVNATGGGTGVMIATATTATSVTYTYATGMSGLGAIPINIGMAVYGIGKDHDGAGRGMRILNSAGSINYTTQVDTAEVIAAMSRVYVPAGSGILTDELNSSSGLNWNVYLSGFSDSSLGIGSNPLF